MKILCSWCNIEKEKKEFTASSLGNLSQGKKAYCFDCKSKYQNEIDKFTEKQTIMRQFSEKHFKLKNNKIEFEKYLVRAMNIQLERMKEIDYESYKSALKLKEDAIKNTDKKRCEKRKLKRKTDEEYKKHLNNLAKKRYIEKGLGEKRKLSKKLWAQKNKEKVNELSKKWKIENPEKYKLKLKKDRAKQLGLSSVEEYEQYLLNNKIERENKKIEKQKEKEKIREEKRLKRIKDAEYRKLNAKKLKEEYRKKQNLMYKEKRKIDKQYQIMDTLRCRTRKILKIQSANKTTNMAKLIGCSGKELADRFISMGYDSNTCHIDHIIPMSMFDLTIPEHQYVACHYLNLQPLNITDNLIKSDSLIDNWEDKIKEICLAVGIDSDSIIRHISNK